MTTASRSGARPAGRARIVLSVVMACQVMVVLTTTVTNLALPGIAKGLAFSPTGLSWVLTSNLLAFGGLLLLGGRMGDILGRRRVFLAGIAVFTLGALLVSTAPSAPVLLTGTTVEGVGAALAEPTSLALLAISFREGARRDRALALFSTVAGIGLAGGTILGGWLALSSWRWALFLDVPIGLLTLAVTARWVDETERRPGRFDALGALTSTAGAALLVYALVHVNAHGWHNHVTVVCLIAALLLLALFIGIELRAEQPVLPLQLFRRTYRAVAYLDIFLIGGASAGLFFFLTQLLQNGLGFTSLRAGFGFLPLAATQFSGSLVAARMLHRATPRTVVSAGALLLAAGTLWLARLTVDAGYTSGVLGPLLLIGAGLGLTIMPLNSAILSDVAPAEAGAASGMEQAALRIGGSIGLAGLLTVAGAQPANPRAPRAQVHAALAHSIAHAFTAATVMVAVVIVISVTLLRPSGMRSSSGPAAPPLHRPDPFDPTLG